MCNVTKIIATSLNNVRVYHRKSKPIKHLTEFLYKGPFINYVRVLREEWLENSLNTLTLERGVKPIHT